MPCFFVIRTERNMGMSKIELDSERRNEEELLRAKEILLSELEKGRSSGETEGWLEADDVFRELEDKYK